MTVASLETYFFAFNLNVSVILLHFKDAVGKIQELLFVCHLLEMTKLSITF